MPNFATVEDLDRVLDIQQKDIKCLDKALDIINTLFMRCDNLEKRVKELENGTLRNFGSNAN